MENAPLLTYHLIQSIEANSSPHSGGLSPLRAPSFSLRSTTAKQNRTRSPGTAPITDTEKLKKGYQAWSEGHGCPRGHSL